MMTAKRAKPLLPTERSAELSDEAPFSGAISAAATEPGSEERPRACGNLFEDAAPPAHGERFDTLVSHRNLVVERILSSARTAPAEFRQRQDEWVLLVRGSATLDDDGRSLQLASGDHVFLPAGTPHTVTKVSEGAVWLAVHLYSAEGVQGPPSAAQQVESGPSTLAGEPGKDASRNKG